MAAIDWPWDLCNIEMDGYVLAPDDNVRRTSFEDGFVRQARTNSNPREAKRFRIFLKESNLVAFKAWAKTYAHTWFNFQAPDDILTEGDMTTKEYRVRGGYAGLATLTRLDGRRLDGEYVWENTNVELEGRQ